MVPGTVGLLGRIPVPTPENREFLLVFADCLSLSAFY
jgi:hypothetical protein